ncbi:enolase C-terminal domain-like protein, partial [Pantoea sp. SIMBA_133]
YEFHDLLRHQAASILQMNLGRVGGILAGKKIAALAEVHYAQIAPHLYNGPVGAAASIQLAATTPNFLIQESIGTWDGFHAEVLEAKIEWSDGFIIPSDRPGLGVELD